MNTGDERKAVGNWYEGVGNWAKLNGVSASVISITGPSSLTLTCRADNSSSDVFAVLCTQATSAVWRIWAKSRPPLEVSFETCCLSVSHVLSWFSQPLVRSVSDCVLMWWYPLLQAMWIV